jgi:hypothetical protein
LVKKVRIESRDEENASFDVDFDVGVNLDRVFLGTDLVADHDLWLEEIFWNGKSGHLVVRIFGLEY